MFFCQTLSFCFHKSFLILATDLVCFLFHIPETNFDPITCRSEPWPGPISEVSPLSGYRLRLTHRLSRQHGTWSTIGKFNRNIWEIVTARTKSLFFHWLFFKNIKLGTFSMLHEIIWCCYLCKWGSYLTRSCFKIDLKILGHILKSFGHVSPTFGRKVLFSRSYVLPLCVQILFYSLSLC